MKMDDKKLGPSFVVKSVFYARRNFYVDGFLKKWNLNFKLTSTLSGSL